MKKDPDLIHKNLHFYKKINHPLNFLCIFFNFEYFKYVQFEHKLPATQIVSQHLKLFYCGL